MVAMVASVVVPTYLRPDLLDRCLAALAAQEIDAPDFEILVADDAGSDTTRRQVERWATRTPVAIRYVTPGTMHGPAAARNAGWKAARGAIIAFTDDDCVPDPHWLSQGLAAFDEEVAAVTGSVVVPIPQRPTDYERDAAGLEAADFVTANCFVRRDVLAAIDGFDERYAEAWREDSDLHFGLIERGYPIVRQPQAVVIHPVRPAPWGISLRQQRKSRFNALLFKKFPALYRRFIRRTPPWGYYAIVASGTAALGAALAGRPRAAWLLFGLWLFLTARFCVRRLRSNSLSLGHVAEMVVTSLLIPPLSIFWRLYGAVQFRVFFL